MNQNMLSKNGGKKLILAVLFIGLLLSTKHLNAQTITENTQDTHDGFFYSFWNDQTNGTASMTLGPAGNYSTTWNNIGNFTAGKGWLPGTEDRVICFSGTYNVGTNGFLAVYGWTRDPLIEYYVVENYGSWVPPGGTSKGTFTSDGGTYNIYETTRIQQPSIDGIQTFQQYWSVRTVRRSTGTVTFANHVAEWKKRGMNMGTSWDYQIMESEGFNSSGSSNITVSDCTPNKCPTPAPTVTAKVIYEPGQPATQLTAIGTSLLWYTTETGGTGNTTAPTPGTTQEGITTYYVSQTDNNCESPRAAITVTVSEIYKIFKTPVPITIDGSIDAEWNSAEVMPVSASKLLIGTIANSADLSGMFKALWDNTYLYILADINDDTRVNDSPDIYEDDGVEVYVDINNDKSQTYGANDAQYTFAWDNGTTVGVLPEGRSTTAITYSVVAKTGGYIVEARIPWSTMQGNPSINQYMGIDFMINDDDDTGSRDSKLSWNSATDNAWENPSLFGIGQLKSEIDVITTIDDIQASNKIAVFPNPVSNTVNLSLKDAQSEISLYAINGNHLMTVTSENIETSIDMSTFDDGIYLLKIVGKGQTVTKKIVKQ